MRTVTTHGIVLALTVLLTGCHESPAPTAPAPSTPTNLVLVFGSVLDFKTNTGIPNATIAFYITGLDATAGEVVTDENGSYAVSLPRGTYNPRINGNGVDSNRGIIRPVGTQYLADYFVNGGNCVMFYGTIRDAASGNPIGGAMVTFVGRTQLSPSDGSYRFDLGCPTGLNPFGTGTIFMRVSSPGYVTQSAYGNRAEFLSGAGLQRIDVSLQSAAASDSRERPSELR
jgi:hypothetical protein